MLAKLILDGIDGGAGALHQRKAVFRVVDCGAKHIRQPHRAVVAQQGHPGVEGAGDAGSQQAGAGYEIKTEFVAVMRNGGFGRRRTLAADHLGASALHVVHDNRHVAAGTVEMRLDHLQCERGGDTGVEGIAAFLKGGHADRGGDPVGRGDDAKGAFDLGPGGEGIGVDVAHGNPGVRRAGAGGALDHSRGSLPTASAQCMCAPDAAQRAVLHGVVRCRAGAVTNAGAWYGPGSAVHR